MARKYSFFLRGVHACCGILPIQGMHAVKRSHPTFAHFSHTMIPEVLEVQRTTGGASRGPRRCLEFGALNCARGRAQNGSFRESTYNPRFSNPSPRRPRAPESKHGVCVMTSQPLRYAIIASKSIAFQPEGRQGKTTLPCIRRSRSGSRKGRAGGHRPTEVGHDLSGRGKADTIVARSLAIWIARRGVRTR